MNYEDITPDDGPVEAAHTRPGINVREDDLVKLINECHEPIRAYNEARPRLFRFSGYPADIATGENDKPVIRMLSQVSMRAHMAHAIRWFRNVKIGKDNWVEQATKPPNDLAAQLLADPTLPLFDLDRVVRCPMFTASGAIVSTPGYSRELKCWLEVPPGSAPSVPDKPTEQDVSDARSLLLDDLLVDFKFVSDADRANALSLFLLPFCRALIDGPTPLYLIEKPTAGSGASYMARALGLLCLGAEPTFITEGTEEDEWRKRITSTLLSTPEIVVVDNLHRRLSSPAFASALTSPLWEDRRLGVSDNVRIPIRNIWVATGNNPTVSTEIARRCAPIRIDPKVDKPAERTDFKRVNLLGWVRDNRTALLRAAMILVRNWFAVGRPKGSVAVGSYDEWSTIFGGILSAAGVHGFMENRHTFNDRADEEGSAWRDFVGLWYATKGCAAVTVRDLVPLAIDTEPVSFSGATAESSQAKRLGKALGKKLDNVFSVNNHKLTIMRGNLSKGTRLWMLASDDSPDTSWLESQADLYGDK